MVEGKKCCDEINADSKTSLFDIVNIDVIKYTLNSNLYRIEL